VNWHASANAKVMLHIVRTDYDDAITIDGDARSAENALLVQVQLQF
jgi:hypothetical protein